MIWIFASVVAAALAATYTAVRCKLLDNDARGVNAKSRIKALEDATAFLREQLGATQRSLLKVDNKIVRVSRAIGKAEVPLEGDKS